VSDRDALDEYLATGEVPQASTSAAGSPAVDDAAAAAVLMGRL
jgi:hypothetical protein